MGYDLYAIKPKTTKASYFRSNIWGWGLLWRLVERECCPSVLSEEEIKEGWWNDGLKISGYKAQMMSKILKEGYKKDWLLRSIIDEVEKPEDGYKKQTSIKDFKSHIAEFYRFCEASRGFKIY